MKTNDLFEKERQAWIDECRAQARVLLATRQEVTIEDVLKKCPRPRYIHKNTTGQIFKHEDFRACGFTKSTRLVSKGRWIMKWSLNEHRLPLSVREVRKMRQGEWAQ